MKNNNEGLNFFDGKTLMAIVLVGFFWLAWERHLQKKYPDAYKPAAETVQESAPAVSVAPTAKTPEVILEKEKETTVSISGSSPEQLVHFEDANLSFDFSSIGMGLKNVVVKSYTHRDGSPIKLGLDGAGVFETALVGASSPLEFQIDKKSENLFVGTAVYKNMKVQKEVAINPKDYSLKVDVKLEGIDGDLVGVKTSLVDAVKSIENQGFWTTMTNPNYDYQHFYAAFNNTSKDAYLMSGFEYVNEAFKLMRILSFSSQYFSMAIVDKSAISPSGEILWKSNTEFHGTLAHEMVNRDSSFTVSYLGYLGPKDLDIVSRVEPGLAAIVDFGMFSVIGRPLLMIMKFFYGMFQNYGVAIILLTLFVRLLILPLNMMGFKSMKKMQIIQPQLKVINEKFKDNAQAKNLATMALFKEHKVNPMGGCLPMLLQLPIFFALYQVFATSIELYRAPFGLWIHDLSYKDPYYVLPVAMAAVMFFQQWVTPSTMDPQQKKVMMFMPLMFSVFMLNLPSGLSLYMFVSGLFGVLQQLYFMRDTAAPAVSKLETV